MEYRRLTASDLASLLELYKQQMQTFSTLEPLTMARLYRLVMLFTYRTLREAIGESAL